MYRRQFLAAAAAAALPDAAFAQAKPTPVTIVSTAGTTQLVLTSLITRMGYFRQLGLQPNTLTVSDGSKVVAALITNAADICPTSGFTQVLVAIERGAPLKILAGGAIKNFSALFSANPKVQTLKDLEGRTVGVGALGTQLHQSMVALFRKYGVDVAKVKFANVGASTDVFKAVSAKVVDAGASEVWLGAANPQVHIVEHGKLYDSIPEFVNQAGFASQSTIAKKRDVLVRTLAAYAKAYRFIMTGDSEAAFVAAGVAVLGQKEAEAVRTQWKFWRQIQPFAADLILPEDRVRYMQEHNLATKSQRALMPYAKVADMSLAREALKLV
jgi:ABC-type nitrate/sulfonate/bicarbonate transport system substrate-binding protein